MGTLAKQLLSNSVSGRQVLVTSLTAVTATTIHTTLSGSSNLDEIWLYAYNSSQSDVVLTLIWGPGSLGSVQDRDEVKSTIPSQSGRTLIANGKLLQNGLTVYSYATIASSINIDGFVNRYTY